MSDYSPQVLPSALPYASFNAQYSPQTTVAINLRQFEKDSKQQAENEYDTDHGQLPEVPADDDLSVSPATRLSLKKKRKVRSAIVSRRKKAIYAEKLEAELEMRDNVNADLETRLGVFRDVLRETSSRIDALQHILEVRNRAVTDNVQKCAHSHEPFQPPQYQQSRGPFGTPVTPTDQQPPHPFLVTENPFDDILSIAPEEIQPGSMYPGRQVQNQCVVRGDRKEQGFVQHVFGRAAHQGHAVAEATAHLTNEPDQQQHYLYQQQHQRSQQQHLSHPRGTDFSSECSMAEAQTSPVTSKYRGAEVPMSTISIREESSWKARGLMDRAPGMFAQSLAFRAAAGM